MTIEFRGDRTSSDISWLFATFPVILRTLADFPRTCDSYKQPLSYDRLAFCDVQHEARTATLGGNVGPGTARKSADPGHSGGCSLIYQFQVVVWG